MFFIRHDTGAGLSVIRLGQGLPGPTEVSYPEGQLLEKIDTQDGKPIIQHPIRDPRPHQWIWKGYTHVIPLYDSMWDQIIPMVSKTRFDAGLTVPVEVWEDESGEKDFDATTDSGDPDLSTYTNLSWTRVKIIRVYRKSRPGGGRVAYEDTVIEFVLAPATV